MLHTRLGVWAYISCMETQWISVRDKLPEPRQRCLVVKPDGDVAMDVYTQFYDGVFDFVYNRIEYWMPLPEPPKR